MNIIAIVLAIIGVVLANGTWRYEVEHHSRQTTASVILSTIGILMCIVGVILGFIYLPLIPAIVLLVSVIIIGGIFMPKN